MVVVRGLNPVTLLTVGSRDSQNPQGWGVFFDKVPTRPFETFLVEPGKRQWHTTRTGNRVTISLAAVSAGGFSGDVRVTFYDNSPLIHVETVMTTKEDWRAIIYDTGLAGGTTDWTTMAWHDTNGVFQSVELDAVPVAVTYVHAGGTGVCGAIAAQLPTRQLS